MIGITTKFYKWLKFQVIRSKRLHAREKSKIIDFLNM